ncbi:MAG: hypothetical protein GF408_01405 [Candidatus Omnitrophica bacterium]|nr:hypothetical protein [Candidatus Omnitrophota bacterium]
MNKLIRRSLMSRTIALIVACTFLWEQVVWAGFSVRDTAVYEAIPGTSVESFLSSERIKKEAIDKKNLLGVISTSPAGGEKAYYDSGRVRTYETCGYPASDIFTGDTIRYHFFDEDHLKSGDDRYGRIKGIDVIIDDLLGEEYCYEITYAAAHDPSDSLISYIARRSLTYAHFVTTSAYYRDAGNRIASLKLERGPGVPEVSYFYRNEQWSGEARGRLDKIVVGNNCGYILFSEYYEGRDQAKYVHNNLCGPGIPGAGRYLYTYDVDGKLLSKKSSIGQSHYYYPESGRISRIVDPDGKYRRYGDEDWNGTGRGRLAEELSISGRRYVWEYHDGTGKVRREKVYGSGDGLLLNVKEFYEEGSLRRLSEYSVYGSIRKQISYYRNGNIEKHTRADGSTEEFFEDGSPVSRIVYLEGRDIFYDHLDRIRRVVDGEVREDRQYITRDGAVLYTQFLEEGDLKNVLDGYCDTTEIVPGDRVASKDPVSVRYDNGITAGFEDEGLVSLSVECGYMNFYSEEGRTLSQSDLKGTLYAFNNNFLKRAATVDGNVYDFNTTDTADGKVVSLTKAFIGGEYYFFTDSCLSSLREDGRTVNIAALELGKTGNIELLAVDRGEGTETLQESDGLFMRIRQALGAIAEDVANVRFAYGPDMKIRDILTGKYSKVEIGKDGKVSGVSDAAGNRIAYDFIEFDGKVAGLKLSDSAGVRTFNAAGDLISIENSDGVNMYFENGKAVEVHTYEGVMDGMDFDASGDLVNSRLVSPDGSEYFFSGGRLSEFVDATDKYTVDGEGRVISVARKATGEVYEVSYSTDITDDSPVAVYTDTSNGIAYSYEGDMLRSVADPTGLKVSYEYDEIGRTAEVEMSYCGRVNFVYSYEYTDEGVEITDQMGTRRVFDSENTPVRIETVYGETYRYSYSVDETGEPITILNYTEKEKGNGLVITYFKGAIDAIDRPDGSRVESIKFDRVSGELERFTLITPEAKKRNVTIDGKFIQLEMEDSTRLVFCENTLVAFASSQGIVPLYDMEELASLLYSRYRNAASSEDRELDVAASSWRHQTHEKAQAIEFVECEYSASQWKANLALKTGDTYRSQGEMFLDLRYDIPGLEWQDPLDMKGKEISFLFKLSDNMEHDPSYPCNIQVFAKDNNWNTQYGTRVEMVQTSDWIKVSLTPSSGNINFGHTDEGFDPSSIVMIGLRISEPDHAPAGKDYMGNVIIKHDMLPDLFADVDNGGSAVDGLYEDLGLVRDLDRVSGDSGITEAEVYLESFVSAMGSGPSDILGKSLLEQVCWHPESEAASVKGISDISRDAVTGDLIVRTDISSVSQANREGEAYFDLRSDVPGLEWAGPVNMTGRPVRMQVKVPPELVSAVQEAPNGARIFVEDENHNMQYGTWINLKEGDKWYLLELTPTFGEVPMGYTDEGFDPSKVVRIGLSYSVHPDSCTQYTGQMRARFMDAEEDIPDGSRTFNTPLWMDLRNIQEYLCDESGNYINVPAVNYVSEENLKYVFNRGSGHVPEADFSAIEKASTIWKTELGGVSHARWSAGGESIIADVNIGTYNKGDMYLDLRYDCYVPDRNWQGTGALDMTSQEITFYVRSLEAASSGGMGFVLEAFAKDAPYWHVEYGESIPFDSSGSWNKVTLTPVPQEFSRGVIDNRGFDPTSIISLGLRFRRIHGDTYYKGPVEIKYQLNEIGLGSNGLGDTGNLPAEPVWANLRDMGAYLRNSEIALYGDFDIMQEVNMLAGEIPDYRLPSDLAAMTVYGKDDKVRSIHKPDGTVSYFDDLGRIDHITDPDGGVFIDYEYNSEGDLANAYMLSARNRLQETMDEAVFDLEKKTADTLLLLAEQAKLLEENYMEEVNAQRARFASARADLESQRYYEVKHSFLWFSWTTRHERPGIKEAIADVNRQEAEYNRQVAGQIAVLDAEISARRDEITTEKEAVLGEYGWQRQKMLLAIRHQEAIPLIHYYYWNVLGRNAVREEIEALYRRMDGTENFAGFFEYELYDFDAFVSSLSSVLSRPLYALFSENTKSVVEGFVSKDDLSDEDIAFILDDLDKMVMRHDLYGLLASCYGSTESLDILLSSGTVAYKNTLTGLNKAEEELTKQERAEISWLNRYMLQEILQGISAKRKGSVPFDASFLENELIGSNEYLASEAFKGDVIGRVKAFFEEYSSDPASRDELLARLGLSEEEIVDVNDGFLSALYTWLESQDVHFGKSAFGALRKMLEEKDVAVDLAVIAREALLIDVLTGITGPLTDEDIEISMYSMGMAAELNGVSARSARVSYEDIIEFRDPFVTLINERHFVTVLSAGEAEVTYWDENLGECGGEITVTRDEFREIWQGNVITDSPLSGEKLLTDTEARSIKGAFIGLIIGAISWAVGAVTAVAAAAVSVVTAVITTMVTVVAEIGLFLVEGIAAIGNFLGFAGEAFMGVFGAGAGIEAAATGFSLATLVESAVPTVVRIGTAYAMNCGLEAMGVDPVVSGLITSVVTGGVSGFIEGGVSEVVSSALKYGAYTGMNLVGGFFDIEPVISSILSMSGGAFIGNVLDPEIPFGEALGDITKNISGQMAYYGVYTAGTAMGWAPEISYLAGVGIRSSLQAGLGTFGAGGNPLDTMWDGFLDAVQIEIPYVLLDYAAQVAGIDPSIAYQLAPIVERLIEPIFESRNLFEGIRGSVETSVIVVTNAIKMLIGCVEDIGSLVGIDDDKCSVLDWIFYNSTLSIEDKREFEFLSDDEKIGILQIVYLNGVGNPEQTGLSPGYMYGFGDQMYTAFNGQVENIYIASYENSPTGFDTLQNVFAWYKDCCFWSDEVTGHITDQFFDIYANGLPDDVIGLAYSGDGDPLIQMLNQNPEINMKTVCLVGAPMYELRKITNTNVQNVIIFQGEDDNIAHDIRRDGVGELSIYHDFNTDMSNLNQYRFVLKEVGHCEYAYDPSDDEFDPIKIKSSMFIANVLQRAKDPLQLEQFLAGDGIEYDLDEDIYYVDLRRIIVDE